MGVMLFPQQSDFQSRSLIWNGCVLIASSALIIAYSAPRLAAIFGLEEAETERKPVQSGSQQMSAAS